jgi:hypothetical protein
MPCRTGCPTQDHANWGECLKASGLQVNTGDANSRRTMSQKSWDAELNAYKSAIDQGIEPATTNMKDIRGAVELSNMAGTAFDANTNSFKE